MITGSSANVPGSSHLQSFPVSLTPYAECLHDTSADNFNTTLMAQRSKFQMKIRAFQVRQLLATATVHLLSRPWLNSAASFTEHLWVTICVHSS